MPHSAEHVEPHLIIYLLDRKLSITTTQHQLLRSSGVLTSGLGPSDSHLLHGEELATQGQGAAVTDVIFSHPGGVGVIK